MSDERNPVTVVNEADRPVLIMTAAAAPLGYGQITALSSAKSLAQTGLGAIPTGATQAIIQATGQDVRWRDDGTNPTASVGGILPAGQTMEVIGAANLAALRFIETTASAVLNVTFYGG